jgi:hypothetical protein
MKHRKPKLPDYAFMLNKVVADGMGVKEIANIIETHGTTVSKTRNESKDIPPGWASSYYLIDLYLRKYGTPIPFFGDHNE